MLFNSAEFVLTFLPITVFVYWSLAPRSRIAALAWAAIASFGFYAWWNPSYLWLILASIGGNLMLARGMLGATAATGRRLVGFGVAANLLLLGYYKYWVFLTEAAGLGAWAQAWAPQTLPLAISFTTFVQVAFLIETYRHRMRVEPVPYAAFVAFFPHLIAGPIVRWSELGPQLADPRRFRLDWNAAALGLTFFAIGLAKKLLLADSMSVHVGHVFDAAAHGAPLTAAAAWGGAVGYGMQLYFDFSAYSDMAIGLGLMFNLRLPVNFVSPYRATSIIDFWRRWHVTLSRFLRDFVYFPLGGSRVGKWRRYVNLLLTMLLGGIWHGAGWTFVAWGALHGLYLALNHGWRAVFPPRPNGRSRRGARLAGWCLTFVAVTVAWVFFRADTLEAALAMLRAMAFMAPGGVPDVAVAQLDRSFVRLGLASEAQLQALFAGVWGFSATGAAIGLLILAVALPDTASLLGYREGAPLEDRPRVLGIALPSWNSNAGWMLVTLALLLATLSRIDRTGEFLYFQF